jgi:hypothetical protein
MIGRPRFGCGDDVGAEHLHRIEVEAAEERHGGDVVGDGIRALRTPSLGSARCSGGLAAQPMNATLAIAISAVDRQFAHMPSTPTAAISANRRFGGQPASFL